MIASPVFIIQDLPKNGLAYDRSGELLILPCILYRLFLYVHGWMPFCNREGRRVSDVDALRILRKHSGRLVTCV